jgi:hypothetical protein
MLIIAEKLYALPERRVEHLASYEAFIQNIQASSAFHNRGDDRA